LELTEILLVTIAAMMPVFLAIALANWRTIRKMAKESENPYDDIVVMGVEQLAERIVQHSKEKEISNAIAQGEYEEAPELGDSRRPIAD